jgi:hypothetical protein
VHHRHKPLTKDGQRLNLYIADSNRASQAALFKDGEF